MVSHSYFTLLNLASFYLLCFFAIGIVVFVSATLPIFLTDVLGIHHKLGDYTGKITFADEVLTMIFAPLWGSLSDKIGTRPIAVTGFFIISIALFLYPTIHNIYPGMLLCRLLFALGASASSSMITAILAEISTFRVSGGKLFRAAYHKFCARFTRVVKRRQANQVTFGGPNGISISADDDLNPYNTHSHNPRSSSSEPYSDDAPELEQSEATPNKGLATRENGNEDKSKTTLETNPAPSEPSPWAREEIEQGASSHDGSSSMGMQPYEFDFDSGNSNPAPIPNPSDYNYYDEEEEEDYIDHHGFPLPSSATDDGFIEAVQPGTRNGKGTAVVGVMAGLGACFGAFVLVALPVYLRLNHGLKPATSVRSAYFIVAGISLGTSIFMFFGLHNDRAKKIMYWVSGRIPESERVALGVHTEAEEDEEAVANDTLSHLALRISYINILKQGFSIALSDPQIFIAYVGSFVARATSVCTVMFIPLMVSAAMTDNENASHCVTSVQGEELTGSCKRGYILSFSVMGIAQTCTLVTAPLWGLAADRFGRKVTLMTSAIFGIFAFSAFGFFGTGAASAVIYFDKSTGGKSSSSLAGAPGGSLTVLYLFGSLMGVSQIGVMISSMSLCTDTRRASSGSIAGVYSFCGGLGILILSLIGGKLADYYSGFPFLIIAILDFILLLAVSQHVHVPILSNLVGKIGPNIGGRVPTGGIRFDEDEFDGVYNNNGQGNSIFGKARNWITNIIPGRRSGGRIRLGESQSDANFINYED